VGGCLGPVAHVIEHRQTELPVTRIDGHPGDDLRQLESHVADAHARRQLEALLCRGQRGLGVVRGDEPGQVVPRSQLRPDEVRALRFRDRLLEVGQAGLFVAEAHMGSPPRDEGVHRHSLRSERGTRVEGPVRPVEG
jgi:hypothetical protein